MDRDLLIRLLLELNDDAPFTDGGITYWADRILALVQSDGGVTLTLTAEEAAWAAEALRRASESWAAPYQRKITSDLAARLEASS